MFGPPYCACPHNAVFKKSLPPFAGASYHVVGLVPSLSLFFFAFVLFFFQFPQEETDERLGLIPGCPFQIFPFI